MLAWVLLSIGLATFIIGIVAKVLELRGCPRCPMHHQRMKRIGNTAETKEYICRAAGCRMCADVELSGHITYFEV